MPSVKRNSQKILSYTLTETILMFFDSFGDKREVPLLQLCCISRTENREIQKLT